jgi:D-3-phosphoglycerate dehydrogenase
VFEKLQSFGVRFLICDPYLTAERKRELGIEVVDKERLFRESDIVTIHTPLTAETRHIVNAAALATMKPGACLVNTARGPMVDAEALAAALSNQTIASAAIDVFDVEPPPPSYPLFGLPNVILTPHLAWYSEDGAWRIRELIVHEIDRFAQGLPPRYRGRPAG